MPATGAKYIQRRRIGRVSGEATAKLRSVPMPSGRGGHRIVILADKVESNEPSGMRPYLGGGLTI
jgi:hypothetical protein